MNRDFHSTATIPLGSELIKRAQQGDAEAFASLFHAHKARIYALCLRMTNNVAEAEDLLQDAFLHVFRKLSSFRGASALSTWIYRIAINTVLMHFRKKSPCQVSLDEPYSNHEHAKPIRREYAARDGRLDSCVTRLVLTRAISALPSGSREIFLLHEVEGYEHHEIAEMLGCSVGNSKSQLHRAKLRLRNFLARRRIARAETGRANGLHTVRAMEQSASLAETWALPPASRIKNMVPLLSPMRDGARGSGMFPRDLRFLPDGGGWPTPIECARTQTILVLRLGQKRFPMNLRTRAITKYLLSLSTVALVFTSLTWAADDKDQSDINKRIDASANVLNEIMATPDKAIPDGIMHDAKCIAVVPSMVKIAVGIGGNHGKGVATCRTANGWSAPAPITITGGSWGLQLGAQAVDLVMVVTNDQGMQHLLSSKFKLGADASAAAGPVGRDATAATDVKMRAEVLTYSRTRGLFAGIDLSGAVINQDKDETTILFGKMVPFEAILSGKVPAPEGSGSFLTAVRKYSMQAKDQAADTEPK